MEDPTFTIDDLFSTAMMANITAVPLRAIAEENAALFEKIRGFDPIKLAATFGDCSQPLNYKATVFVWKCWCILRWRRRAVITNHNVI